MSKGLVLISGINGYIAAVTAKHFLDAGYSVRGTIRRISSAKPLIEGPLKSFAESGRFEVIEVPDITTDGAFDEAVKGVTFIAHLASPVSMSFTDPKPILHAAVQGTKTILASALKAGPQLKTFVQLSSIAANMTNEPPPSTLNDSTWNNFAEYLIDQNSEHVNGPIIYAASKAASERALWAFKEEKKPAFTIAAINPVFVIGAPLVHPKTPEEVNGTIIPIWSVFSGAEYQPGESEETYNVDVRDVAALVEAVILKPQETDGQRYIAHSGVATAQSIADVLRKALPETRERIAEGKPGEGYRADYQVSPEKKPEIDSSRGRKLLGRDWISIEDSVVDTAKAFAKLV